MSSGRRSTGPSASSDAASGDAVSGSAAKIRVAGESSRDHRGDARQQAAAAERRDDRADVRQVLEDLERQRAVSRDELIVVERVHEVTRHPRRSVIDDRLPALVVAGLHDRRAQPFDRANLRLGRRVHHHDRAARAEVRAASATPCAALPALTVQTPSSSTSARQLAHRVVRAANLERADRLQQLELEIDLGQRKVVAGQVEANERRADGGVVHGGRGIADRRERDVA